MQIDTTEETNWQKNPSAACKGRMHARVYAQCAHTPGQKMRALRPTASSRLGDPAKLGLGSASARL